MASVVVGEASSSSPPPSTSIPPPISYTYDVFLSFRGEDTRIGFTDHLRAALERKGIKAFRDDKYLETGVVTSIELMKAIEESMFAIVILSPNYASSSWCLYELQHIVALSRRRARYIVPVFYGVTPSDVRCQKGSFEEAFRKHEESRNRAEVRRWREALTDVASHAGWDSKDKLEAELVESIAQDICKKLSEKLAAKKPVGTPGMMEVARVIRIWLNNHFRIAFGVRMNPGRNKGVDVRLNTEIA